MFPTLSYTNLSISAVLVLVKKYIVYQQIVGICCEILTFYCCTKYCLSYRSMHLPIVVVQKEHCLPTNYHKIGVESLNFTCLQSFVHVSVQVIELQELARPIVMYGTKFFPKRRCLHKFHYPYFSASPNSITSLSFRCRSIPVSEICEFNQKKEKMNISKNGYCRFDTFAWSKWTHF